MPGRIAALIAQAEKVHGALGEIIANMKQVRTTMPAGRYSKRINRENQIHENTWLYECEHAAADLDKLCKMMSKDRD